MRRNQEKKKKSTAPPSPQNPKRPKWQNIFSSEIPRLPRFVCRSPESMLRAAPRRPGRRLQDQLAHDDAHGEEEHDEGDGADAQALLFLDGDRGVRGRHHVALPHPKAVVLLVGGVGWGGGHKVQKRRYEERR